MLVGSELDSCTDFCTAIRCLIEQHLSSHITTARIICTLEILLLTYWPCYQLRCHTNCSCPLCLSRMIATVRHGKLAAVRSFFLGYILCICWS